MANEDKFPLCFQVRRSMEAIDEMEIEETSDKVEVSREVGRETSFREDDGVWIVRRFHDSSEDEESSEESLHESSQVADSKRTAKVGCCSERQENGQMCLHEAADTKCTRNFHEIFKGTFTKADVNRPNIEGERPLHYAAEIGFESVVGFLIDKGADVNVQDDDGFTPLILAANYGHVEVCRLLLDAGAPVNFQDDLEMTALHFAASMGHADVVRLLLDRGADPTLEEDGGLRAYHYAQDAHQYEVEKILLQAERARLLRFRYNEKSGGENQTSHRGNHVKLD